MQKSLSKGFSGWSQLWMFIALFFGAMVFSGIASIIIWKLMVHGNMSNMEKDMFKPQNLNATLILQCVSTFLLFFVPTLVFAKICYTNSLGFLGFKGNANWKQLLIVVLLVAVSLPLIGALANLNKMIPLPKHLRASMDAAEKAYNDQVMIMAQIKSWGQYFVSLFVIAFLPAVFEETLFRGGLQQLLTRWIKIPWLAILITSLLFSAIHFSWYGFFARAALGAVLGLVFYYGQNIWLNISLHFLNNAFVVTTMFVLFKQGKPVNMDDDGSNMPLWIGAIGLILVIELIRWFKKVSPPEPILDDLYLDDVEYDNPFKNDKDIA